MNNYSIFGQKKKRKIPEEEVLGGCNTQVHSEKLCLNCFHMCKQKCMQAHSNKTAITSASAQCSAAYKNKKQDE